MLTRYVYIHKKTGGIIIKENWGYNHKRRKRVIIRANVFKYNCNKSTPHTHHQCLWTIRNVTNGAHNLWTVLNGLRAFSAVQNLPRTVSVAAAPPPLVVTVSGGWWYHALPSACRWGPGVQVRYIGPGIRIDPCQHDPKSLGRRRLVSSDGLLVVFLDGPARWESLGERGSFMGIRNVRQDHVPQPRKGGLVHHKRVARVAARYALVA